MKLIKWIQALRVWLHPSSHHLAGERRSRTRNLVPQSQALENHVAPGQAAPGNSPADRSSGEGKRDLGRGAHPG